MNSQQQQQLIVRYLNLDELKQLEKLGIQYVFHPKQIVPPEHSGVFRRHVIGISPADWERVTQKQEHKEPAKPAVVQQVFPFNGPFNGFDKPAQQQPFGGFSF
jgi:hypothetical protein